MARGIRCFHSSKQCCWFTLLRTLLVCSQREFSLGAEISQVKVSLHFFVSIPNLVRHNVSGFSCVRLVKPVRWAHIHTRRVIGKKHYADKPFWRYSADYVLRQNKYITASRVRQRMKDPSVFHPLHLFAFLIVNIVAYHLWVWQVQLTTMQLLHNRRLIFALQNWNWSIY